MFKNGGKLTEPGAANVIAKGKLHKENNNLGNKDKGIPVINSKGEKEYELEKEELVLRLETTKTAEDFAKRFNDTRDEGLLEELGALMHQELMGNTQDYSKKFNVDIE